MSRRRRRKHPNEGTRLLYHQVQTPASGSVLLSHSQHRTNHVERTQGAKRSWGISHNLWGMKPQKGTHWFTDIGAAVANISLGP
jgi:hypothetical protein